MKFFKSSFFRSRFFSYLILHFTSHFILICLFIFSLHPSGWTQTLMSPDFNQNPPSLRWRVLETTHFKVIYPKSIAKDAKKVALLLEKLHPIIGASLKVNLKKISLILHNQSLVSNGFVSLGPRRTEWVTTPSIDPELSNTQWLKTLAIHELRHVAQFDKNRQKFNRDLSFLFGDIGEMIGLSLTAPPWYYEGDAVGIETAWTRGGRGRLPLFDRDLRAVLLSQFNDESNNPKTSLWSYDKAHLGSYKDYVPNHYIYGYFYTSYLKNQFGHDVFSSVIDDAAQKSWNPLSFYNAMDKLAQEDFEQLYQKILKHLQTKWSEHLNSDDLTKIKVLSPSQKASYPASLGNKNKIDWVNYEYPQWDSQAQLISLKSGLSFIYQFVRIKNGKEELLYTPAPLSEKYPYRLRNDLIAFLEIDLDQRWGERNFSRLKVLDVSTKKIIFDKKKMRAKLAVLDHDAKIIAFIEWSESQEQFLCLINLKGNILHRYKISSQQLITSLDWRSSHEIIMTVKNQFDKKGILTFNLKTQRTQFLLEPRDLNIGHVFSYEGHLFFEAPDSGIDNIFQLKNGKSFLLTNAKFGAYAPLLQNGKLIYNNYSAHGMEIVTKNQNWNIPQKSYHSFYPIYKKFAVSENPLSKTFSFLDSDQKKHKPESSFSVKEISKKEKDYSQLEKFYRPHSWIFLAPPLTNSLFLTAINRNLLNTVSWSIGSEYNLNEKSLGGFISSTFSYYYPVFNLSASYQGRNVVVKNEMNQEKRERWEEGVMKVETLIPWAFLEGAFTHQLKFKLFSDFIKVVNKSIEDPHSMSDGFFISPGLGFEYSLLKRISHRDIYPSLGFSFKGEFMEGRDVSGKENTGSLLSLENLFYLPGVFDHHSFFHQLAYEKQNDNFYQYPSNILFPRGVSAFFLKDFLKYSANYSLPLAYPDWNMSRYLYLKRVLFNLFFDQIKGYEQSINIGSTGAEVLFDLHFFRISFPLRIGLRATRVLFGSSDDKDQGEIFLSTGFNF